MSVEAGVQPVPILTRLREAVPHGRGLPEEDWNRRHRGLLAILWLHTLAVPAFGIAQGYGVVHALAESSIIPLAAIVAGAGGLGRNLRSAAVSVGLLTASALLVHFSGGYIEFHFHFFVMIGLLALYQHWLPFLLAISYVALHHGIGGAIDPEAVYNHADGVEHPWKWAAIHAGFVLAASTANVFAWRYFEQEQQRRRDLLLVTEAALSRLPLTELLDEVLRRVSEVLKADTTTISLWDEDGQLTIAAALGGEPADKGAVLFLDDVVAGPIAIGGRPVVVEDAHGKTIANPVHSRAGVRSLAGVPLLAADTPIGMLDVGTVLHRRFSSSDVTLLELAAERIAPAIDRARLHERDHRIAAILQRSLLPKTLPNVPGVSVAFRYEPAGESIEAGGDWYDAFALSGNRLGLVIGDVVGRGTEAASLMGQLRTGLRAYAMEGHPPAEIFPRLSHLARELDPENMATLLYVQLDPATAIARYASAGHLPPLLVRPDRPPEYLWEGRGTPIGSPAAGRWKQAEVQLEPGSTLVLCTDGLIEGRAAPIDDGFRRLEQSVVRNAALTPEALCDALVEQVPVEGTRDDVAVMVVRLAPSLDEHLELELPAVPESAVVVRRTLERWLSERDIPSDTVHDVVLASSEASANAIEHAYAPGDAAFRVNARQENGAVVIAVADGGHWRSPRPGAEGRGLDFMEALMDEVELERGAEGTTVTMRKLITRDSDVELLI